MYKKILLVGGGTGGHVYPLLNLVKYLQKNKPEHDGDMQFHWIGEADSIESRVTSENQIPFSPIVCGKLRRYFSFQTLLTPFQVLTGIVQSMVILHREKPTAIFSKGGYVSLPVALAGWTLRIPIYLHESDSIPGLANRIVGHFASGIFCAFSEADSFFDAKKILAHGPFLSNEIQEMIFNGDGSTGQACLPDRQTGGGRTQILVSCGSQGSASIFDAVFELLPNFSDADFHIVLGVKNPDFRAKFEQFSNVSIYDFFYDQSEFLEIVQKCDLVIARSGSSIFEFEALGLHMILIPHPFTGNNHQYWNAKAFEKKGHELLEQKNISDLPSILEKYRTYKKSVSGHTVNLEIYKSIQNIL